MKVCVIGAGFVGATVAQRVFEQELADVVLVDILSGVPQGKSLDMQEAAPVLSCDGSIKGSNDFEDIAGSDIVVVTAGLPRQPGMSRQDLLNKNASIIRLVVHNIRDSAPNAIIIMVTNPLDIMTYLAFKETGFPAHRVLGMAGVLDSARFRAFLAMETGVSVKDIHTMVLGGHGDSMVPVPEFTTIGGVPVSNFVSDERMAEIIERTRTGGAEIVNLLKTGSAYYAPSASVVSMIEAIVKDQRRFLPVSAYLEGQYGQKGIYLGVPAIIGANGVERVVELKLSEQSKVQLDASAQAVKSAIAQLDI